MTQFFRIADENFWNNIQDAFQDGGGIYKLFCVDENGKRIFINRVLKSDAEVVLYIGVATCFIHRVVALKKSVSPNHKEKNHKCGTRYKASPLLMQKFPFEQLFVELTSSVDAKKMEKKLLKEYEAEFGELPPLNRNI